MAHGGERGLSQRRSCGLFDSNRATIRYQPRPKDDGWLTEMLKIVAAEFPRYGVRRCHVMLRREHLRPEHGRVNHKRVRRLYRSLGLQVRRRKRKRIAATQRQPLPVPAAPNEHWCMDFTSDQTARGQRFRTLNLVDIFTRECLEIDVATSLTGRRVTEMLDRVCDREMPPRTITIDNGPEFISRALDVWAYERGVTLHFIRPGKPVENAFIESFNSRFRDEFLNQNWFHDLPDARRRIADFRTLYNHRRPHSSLGYLTPIEFRTQDAQRRSPPPFDGASDAIRRHGGGLDGPPASNAGGAIESCPTLAPRTESHTTTNSPLQESVV